MIVELVYFDLTSSHSEQLLQDTFLKSLISNHREIQQEAEVQHNHSQDWLTWRPGLSWEKTGNNETWGKVTHGQGSLALHVVCKSAGQESSKSSIKPLPVGGALFAYWELKGKMRLCSMPLRWRWRVRGEGSGQSLLPSLKLIRRKGSLGEQKSRFCNLPRDFAE